MECETSKNNLQKAIALLRQGLTLITVIAISGCAAYRPLPFPPKAVRTKLRPPDMAELRILASKISHPILHPVEIKPDKDLSPDGAAVLAVLLNSSLRALRDQRALSNAQLLDVGLLPNPQLDYSLDIPTGGNTKGKINAYGLELTWQVISLISHAADIGRTKAHKKAVDLDIAWQDVSAGQIVGKIIGTGHLRIAAKTGAARLTVPQSAIVYDSKEWPYLLIEKDGAYKPHRVRLSLRQGGWVETLSGLKQNQTVVSKGAYELFYRGFTRQFKVQD